MLCRDFRHPIFFTWKIKRKGECTCWLTSKWLGWIHFNTALLKSGLSHLMNILKLLENFLWTSVHQTMSSLTQRLLNTMDLRLIVLRWGNRMKSFVIIGMDFLRHILPTSQLLLGNSLPRILHFLQVYFLTLDGISSMRNSGMISLIPSQLPIRRMLLLGTIKSLFHSRVPASRSQDDSRMFFISRIIRLIRQKVISWQRVRRSWNFSNLNARNSLKSPWKRGDFLYNLLVLSRSLRATK